MRFKSGPVIGMQHSLRKQPRAPRRKQADMDGMVASLQFET